VAVLVEVGAGGSADRFFGSLVERGSERFLGPVFFGCGWMTAFKEVGNRAFGCGLRQTGFGFILGH
jgi:hypothetical protein